MPARLCRLTLFGGGALALAAFASAQAPAFQTPGMAQPRLRSGQTDRFDNSFNPALGFVLDTLAVYTDTDRGSDADDGFDLSLRTLELNANAWVDPSIWAYVVVFADETEVELEEAAAHYVGWDSNATVKAGRFFVDFGKQMQSHVDELVYPDRPLVLEEYLGEELSGTGVQLDNWFTVGEETVVRYSLGVFDSLLGAGHGEEEPAAGPDTFDKERKDVDELALTLRLTAFSDAGENGTLQVGVSSRYVPDFGFEDDQFGLMADDLENVVYGADVTYGWTDETALRKLTVGAEALLFDGDIRAEVLNPGTGSESLQVVDDDAFGFYAWADYGWSANDSAGALASQAQRADTGEPTDREWTIYYTRNLTEYSRLRFALSYLDAELDRDETALVVQFTSFMGAHGHGVNW